MYKIILLLMVSLFLMGCGGNTDPGKASSRYNTICIDGVKYIYFKGFAGYKGYGYMSVKFNSDGNVETCNNFIPEPAANESY